MAECAARGEAAETCTASAGPPPSTCPLTRRREHPTSKTGHPHVRRAGARPPAPPDTHGTGPRPGFTLAAPAAPAAATKAAGAAAAGLLRLLLCWSLAAAPSPTPPARTPACGWVSPLKGCYPLTIHPRPRHICVPCPSTAGHSQGTHLYPASSNSPRDRPSTVCTCVLNAQGEGR